MAGTPVVLTGEGTPLSAADKQAGLILVTLGPKNLNRGGDATRTGIFHEFDDRHPDGEALVVAGRVSKVFNTAGVAMAKARGLLADTDKPETPTTSVIDALDNTVTSQQALAAKDAEIAALKAQIARTGTGQDAKPATPVAPVTPLAPVIPPTKDTPKDK